MAKVSFHYYKYSPRMHISHIEEMDIIPIIGDSISLINYELYALNKEIKDKNFIIEFKVVKRSFRMIKLKNVYCDVRLELEPVFIK